MPWHSRYILRPRPMSTRPPGLLVSAAAATNHLKEVNKSYNKGKNACPEGNNDFNRHVYPPLNTQGISVRKHYHSELIRS